MSGDPDQLFQRILHAAQADPQVLGLFLSGSRGRLDGYINSVYRSLKCLRKQNRLGAQLEAGDVFDSWGANYPWMQSFKG
jgi:hypothetical protein